MKIEEEEKETGWKQKLTREITEYSINFIYLALFFGFFAWYSRLVLAKYQIAYLNYGIALIKALVLAKVIMLGDVFRLGVRLENRPLIIPTLYKATVFTILVAFFDVVEATIKGLIRGEGPQGGIEELASTGWHGLLARCLVVFFAFIPFFAFRELGRILGEGTIGSMYFRKGAAAEYDRSRREMGRR